MAPTTSSPDGETPSVSTAPVASAGIGADTRDTVAPAHAEDPPAASTGPSVTPDRWIAPDALLPGESHGVRRPAPGYIAAPRRFGKIPRPLSVALLVVVLAVTIAACNGLQNLRHATTNLLRPAPTSTVAPRQTTTPPLKHP